MVYVTHSPKGKRFTTITAARKDAYKEISKNGGYVPIYLLDNEGFLVGNWPVGEVSYEFGKIIYTKDIKSKRGTRYRLNRDGRLGKKV